MHISYWPLWLALFSFAVVITIPIVKRTKNHVPAGHKDTPIHQKPFFQLSSFLVGLVILFLFIV